MNGPDREFLEDTASKIVATREGDLKTDRHKRFWLGLLANAIVTTIILVPVLLGVSNFFERETRELTQHIDRNAELTACILIIEPQDRTPENINECVDTANLRLRGGD